MCPREIVSEYLTSALQRIALGNLCWRRAGPKVIRGVCPDGTRSHFLRPPNNNKGMTRSKIWLKHHVSSHRFRHGSGQGPKTGRMLRAKTGWIRAGRMVLANWLVKLIIMSLGTARNPISRANLLNNGKQGHAHASLARAQPD